MHTAVILIHHLYITNMQIRFLPTSFHPYLCSVPLITFPLFVCPLIAGFDSINRLHLPSLLPGSACEKHALQGHKYPPQINTNLITYNEILSDPVMILVLLVIYFN